MMGAGSTGKIPVLAEVILNYVLVHAVNAKRRIVMRGVHVTREADNAYAGK